MVPGLRLCSKSHHNCGAHMGVQKERKITFFTAFERKSTFFTAVRRLLQKQARSLSDVQY